jgi:RND superfamily putative drug exporter
MPVIKFITGRRTKFVVLAIWVLTFVLLGSAAGRYEDAQKNDNKSYLPGEAESLKAVDLEVEQSGEVLPGVMVYYRASGLTDEDKAAIEADAADLNENRVKFQLDDAEVTFANDDKTAALTIAVKANGDGEELQKVADDIRKRTEDNPAGLQHQLTGGIGFSDDSIEIFKSMNGLALAGAALLVITLLLLIYRSPILWLLPIISVFFAENASRGIGTLIAESGTTVNSQAAIVTTILVFGVGTDYALLLIARYREELRRHEDRHEAMAFALRRSSPAILASAGTVVIALLTMVLGELNSTASTGWIGAIGVSLAMLSMLTLLPALLLIAGRRSFWPFVPKFDSPDHFTESGFWGRLAAFVQRRKHAVIVAVFGLVAVMSIGWTQFDTGLTQLNGFTKTVESVEGQKTLEKTLPPGVTGPAVIMVSDPAKADAVAESVEEIEGVVSVAPPQTAKGISRIEAVLGFDPYSSQARAIVPKMRSAVDATAPGAAHVGGVTAIDYDVRRSATRDNKVIIPLTLAVIFVILLILLRAIVAPLVLILTVILSYFAVVGLGLAVFEPVFGFAGIDASFPLWAFIFLVALGVDYNIFLTARVREEVAVHGASEGMRRGLVATGGVITSAAVVLAGTFAVLGVMPFVFMNELGMVVAFGVLFDAMLIRSMLVPAVGWELGPKFWWPSALSRQKDVDEHPDWH